MSDANEKRNYKRAKVKTSIRYRKMNEYSIPAETDNMGGGGLMFYSPKNIPISTYLILEVPLPIFPAPVKIQGRVAWTRKNEAWNNYSIGVEFTKILEDDKKKLIDYIEARL
ncbi:MAG: PilZ domain-containing protein [bacterium]